jgi:hypothetical protein
MHSWVSESGLVDEREQKDKGLQGEPTFDANVSHVF